MAFVNLRGGSERPKFVHLQIFAKEFNNIQQTAPGFFAPFWLYMLCLAFRANLKQSSHLFFFFQKKLWIFFFFFFFFFFFKKIFWIFFFFFFFFFFCVECNNRHVKISTTKYSRITPRNASRFLFTPRRFCSHEHVSRFCRVGLKRFNSRLHKQRTQDDKVFFSVWKNAQQKIYACVCESKRRKLLITLSKHPNSLDNTP